MPTEDEEVGEGARASYQAATQKSEVPARNQRALPKR